MVTLALVLWALAQAPTYVWVDAAGEPHYTDDLSTVPKGAKVHTTEGDPVGVVPHTVVPGQAEPDGGSAPSPPHPSPDGCQRAQAQLAAAEARLAEARAQPPEDDRQRCTRLLHTLGAGAYAQCMQGGSGDHGEQPEAVEAAAAAVERAKERLRKAQYTGCR